MVPICYSTVEPVHFRSLTFPAYSLDALKTQKRSQLLKLNSLISTVHEGKLALFLFEGTISDLVH
jgi:hypothetical protein